jgi:KDO2-lipid IV(A) lauroyltransferase
LHAIFHAARICARRAPRRAVLFVGARIGEIAARVSPGAVRQTILNLEHVTGVRIGADARASVRVIARRIGENAADVLRAREGAWPAVRIEGRTHLDAALAGGRGAVIVSAHHGPWELMPIALAQAGYRVALVTRPLRDPVWEKWIGAVRREAGVHVFPRGTPATEVARWTSQGGVLGIALDQRVRGAVVDATFVGLPAPAVRGPVVIAQRARAPLLACTVRRVAPVDLVATISPALQPVTDARGIARRDRTTRVLTRHLDALVRRDITQWVWWHERFSLDSAPAPPSDAVKQAPRRIRASRTFPIT